MRKVILFVLLLVLGVPLMAQNAVKIGLIVPASEIGFYDTLVAGAQAAADEQGFELTVLVSNEEVETELSHVQELLEAGVNALLIYPVDADNTDAIAAANEADVPVFVLEQRVSTEVTVQSVVTLDDVAVGEAAGDYFCANLDESDKLLILQGLTAEEALEDMEDAALVSYMARQESMAAFMDENCAAVERIVEASETYLYADSLAYFEELAGERGAFNAVLAADAELILSTIEAGQSARLRGVSFATFERSDAVLGAMETGDLSLLIIPDPEQLGMTAIATIATFVSGEEIEAVVTVDLIIVDSESATQFRDPPGT